ncbi:hypothetical protein CKO28_23740 [Rhodovibrio sodomensis]|uniref:Putative DNA-binding domain-containing protein n=1 Tax=Rhodovibrio sodomensis TaxID=1088 RepID=A0ABS1DLB8_9PROT|nr:DNA-binding domain-containing protein [Rhodovibrio sodomensis]MBK1671024.1 hypothetical protein [Rhodovibrio sodomensis]
MPALKVYQEGMRAVVIGGDPVQLADHGADPADTWRAAVYRNTYAAGCAEALGSSFPAVSALVGRDYFRALAQAYVGEHPPSRRSLVGYGAAMADFLRSFPPVAELAYLPAVAALDRAWLEAHVAADAEPMTAEHAAALESAGGLDSVAVDLHPSVQRIALNWTVYPLWKALRAGETPGEEALQLSRAEDAVLVWRPGQEVRHRRLSGAEAAFLGETDGGGTLGEGADAAARADPDADIAPLFAQLLHDGVLVQPPQAA